MSIRGCLLGCFSIIGVVLFFAFLIGLAAWFEGSAMAHMQDDDGPVYRPSVYRQLVSLIAMKRTTDGHFPRVEDAQVRLEERLGVVLGDEAGAPR